MGLSEEIEALPFVDEHGLEVGAGAAVTWEALRTVVERSFGSGVAPHVGRLLGCEDEHGFHLAAERPPGAGPGPAELALAGRHRFSRYALVFRIDALGPERSRLRAETRAEFPGIKGGAYRALVIGSRGHVLATRRLLGTVKRRAERAAAG